MFKVLAVSALFMVFACEAANLGCKKEVSPALGGICADGFAAVQNGEGCCDTDSVYDIDSYGCKEVAGPAIFGICPGSEYIITSGEECCLVSDAYVKK